MPSVVLCDENFVALSNQLPKTAIRLSLWLWQKVNSTGEKLFQISYAMIAKLLEVSMRTAIRVVKLLTEAGIIDLKHQFRADGGFARNELIWKQGVPNPSVEALSGTEDIQQTSNNLNLNHDVLDSAVPTLVEQGAAEDTPIVSMSETISALPEKKSDLPDSSELSHCERRAQLLHTNTDDLDDEGMHDYVTQVDRQIANETQLIDKEYERSGVIKKNWISYEPRDALKKFAASQALMDQCKTAVEQLNKIKNSLVNDSFYEKALRKDFNFIHSMKGARQLSSFQYNRLISKLNAAEIPMDPLLINGAIYGIRFGSFVKSNRDGSENSEDKAINVVLKLIRDGTYRAPLLGDMIAWLTEKLGKKT